MKRNYRISNKFRKFSNFEILEFAKSKILDLVMIFSKLAVLNPHNSSKLNKNAFKSRFFSLVSIKG
jgi:hypothetical protein